MLGLGEWCSVTWSYLSSGPGSSDRSWVRLRIGDNSSDDQLLQNEEIDLLLDTEGSKYGAAAVAARTIAAKYARRVDRTIGKLRISMQQASQHYFALADKIDDEAMSGAAGSVGMSGMYAGGISITEKLSEEADTDRVKPAFTRGQFDNHGG